MKVKEKSSAQKIEIAGTFVVGILIFYAGGITTNLFGNPVFSMFWVISNETAHNVAAYAALTITIAVDLMILIMFLFKRRCLRKSFEIAFVFLQVPTFS